MLSRFEQAGADASWRCKLTDTTSGLPRQAGARLRAQAKVYALQRVVLPVSGLASWLLVAAGGLMTLHVLGINIAPLLTVGGVSGIIVGLSAQSVMSNMISGINLVRALSSSVKVTPLPLRGLLFEPAYSLLPVRCPTFEP